MRHFSGCVGINLGETSDGIGFGGRPARCGRDRSEETRAQCSHKMPQAPPLFRDRKPVSPDTIRARKTLTPASLNIVIR
ncbi:protein of unknown function (plasmid) [Cupriavidus taiwanensis]|uniref:Uncharacterized protein n=1 Tax=Cupriavidus taiwanensis TaxID=164546 RepID=A0A375H9M3_9BURK|nr:protein of unknown function [Cupriavidus taiwanensis]SPD48711.1 protein of unknown function [Cupriavidus taiwanensis]